MVCTASFVFVLFGPIYAMCFPWFVLLINFLHTNISWSVLLCVNGLHLGYVHDFVLKCLPNVWVVCVLLCCYLLLWCTTLGSVPSSSSLSFLTLFSPPSSPLLLLIEAAEQREIERRKKEEKATLKKLHKIIEKEKKKKTKKSRHKKKWVICWFIPVFHESRVLVLMHYPGTEKRLPRHQILRNIIRKPGGNQERTIHQMSPLLQSPVTTLTVVRLYHLNHLRWRERTGNMNLDQGFSLQAHSNRLLVLLKTRVGGHPSLRGLMHRHTSPGISVFEQRMLRWRHTYVKKFFTKYVILSSVPMNYNLSILCHNCI